MRLAIFVIVVGLALTVEAQDSANKEISPANQRLIELYGPHYPVGPDPMPDTPPLKRLMSDPNDAYAIRAYASEVVGNVDLISEASLTPEDFRAARMELAELEDFLYGLPAETPAAQAAIAGAKVTARTGREMVMTRETPLAEFKARLLEDPGNPIRIANFRERLMYELYHLVGSNPYEAERELDEAIDTFKLVEDAVPADSRSYSHVVYSPTGQLQKNRFAISHMEQLIETRKQEKKRLQALIGSGALPLEVNAWVNGSPLNDQLQGKIVLLEFFAGCTPPALEALEELNELDEKYGDNGVVIIGATTYCGQQWDNTTESATRDLGSEENLSQSSEREMVAGLANELNLEFRFAFLEVNAYQELLNAYGGQEVPYLVLFDQECAIRLIRSGEMDVVITEDEPTAKDVGAMIEKLLEASRE